MNKKEQCFKVFRMIEKAFAKGKINIDEYNHKIDKLLPIYKNC